MPQLAGEAALETPPLVYLVAAAGFAKLFASLLPLHDAARLASGVFMGLTFWFTALTARELYGRDYAGIAAIGLLGCVGWIVRAHQLIPDVPLLTGISLGLYGLAVAARKPLLGGTALGIGIGVGFLARGLVAPTVLVAIALLQAVLSRLWRRAGILRNARQRVSRRCAVARHLAARPLPTVARSLSPVVDPGPHRRAVSHQRGGARLGVAPVPRAVAVVRVAGAAARHLDPLAQPPQPAQAAGPPASADCAHRDVRAARVWRRVQAMSTRCPSSFHSRCSRSRRSIPCGAAQSARSTGSAS